MKAGERIEQDALLARFDTRSLRIELPELKLGLPRADFMLLAHSAIGLAPSATDRPSAAAYL